MSGVTDLRGDHVIQRLADGPLARGRNRVDDVVFKTDQQATQIAERALSHTEYCAGFVCGRRGSSRCPLFVVERPIEATSDCLLRPARPPGPRQRHRLSWNGDKKREGFLKRSHWRMLAAIKSSATRRRADGV